MSRQIQDVYIAAATRTPVGKAPRGVLKNTRPDDLLSHVIQAVLAQAPGFDKSLVEDVIVGCAMPEAEQGMNVARIGALLAGLPDTVPGMTINRFCSSGLQTIAMAADRIALGQADAIIAGGTESMSMIPMGGNRFVANPRYFSDDEAHVGIAYSMGITAENLAKRYEITREQQDAYAFESHQRAVKAIKANEFKDEISPVTVKEHHPDLNNQSIKEKIITVDTDEGPRADTSLEQMAKLRPVFAAKGTVTAASSSQMSDGAAAVLVVSEKILKQFNLTPLAKFHGFAVAGVAPEIMGIGPVSAIPKVLKQVNLNLSDMDWIELNEAFAVQTLAVMKDLDLDHAKVNPNGGAIALGHPLGATGAIRTATIVHAMQRKQLKYGMVTMCIGTGMGAAGVFERV